MALNIGIDLCDDLITAYSLNEKSMLSVPAVICREKKEDLWYIGEQAYRKALSGEGVLTDKLLSLLKKNGTSTIQRRAYTAEQLLSRLIAAILFKLINDDGLENIGSLVIALKRADKEEMDAVSRAVGSIGIDIKRVSVISHQEAFIHYMMSQEKSLYYNMAGLFDLSGEMLTYYKLKVARGGKPGVYCESEDLEEAFRADITKNESGSELADRIMADAAKRCMGNDIYSSVFLTGKGFERTDWARSFIELICKRRRVLYEPGLFAIGAAICAGQSENDLENGYTIVCDTRTDSEVSLSVLVNERSSRLIMVNYGMPWHDISTYAEVIPRGQSFVDVDIEPLDRIKQRRTIRIELDSFPKRPDMCTRVSIEMHFESADVLSLSVRDLGFGEIYPASGIVIRENIRV